MSDIALRNRIMDDVKIAMREKDALKLETLRFLQAAIKNREIELRPEAITEDEVMAVMKKLIKQRKESIEQFDKAGRKDLSDKENQELKYLEFYLPAQMGREQIDALVQSVVKELGANSVKDMGRVMKEVQARAQGAADNKIVSELVKAKLN